MIAAQVMALGAICTGKEFAKIFLQIMQGLILSVVHRILNALPARIFPEIPLTKRRRSCLPSQYGMPCLCPSIVSAFDAGLCRLIISQFLPDYSTEKCFPVQKWF